MRVNIYRYDDGEEKHLGVRYVDEAVESYCPAIKDDQAAFEAECDEAERVLKRDHRYWLSESVLLRIAL